MRTLHFLDAENNPVSVEIAQDCIVFMSGVEPEQEHIISVETTENVSLRTDFIGERPRHEER
jgi:hypothetical protein